MSCKNCEHATQITLTNVYCVHPDNYMTALDPDEVEEGLIHHHCPYAGRIYADNYLDDVYENGE